MPPPARIPAGVAFSVTGTPERGAQGYRLDELVEIIEVVPLPVFAESEAVFRPSHRGIGLGSFEKVECLGSGADAKAAAGVPHVCPDCVRGENE